YVADNTPLPRPAGYHLTQQVSFVDAAAMAAGQAATGYQYYDLPEARFGVQAVVHHGPTSRSYLIAPYDGTRVAVLAVTDPLASSRKMERALVGVHSFGYPVDAPQLGSSKTIILTNTGNIP